MKSRIFRVCMPPLVFSTLIFILTFFFSENKALATFEPGHISIDSITPNPATTNITISGTAEGGADIANDCPAQPPGYPALTTFHPYKLDTSTYQIDNNTLKGEYTLTLLQSGNPAGLVCAHDPSTEKYFKYSFRFSIDIGVFPVGHHTITLYALNGLNNEISFDSANFTKFGGSYIVTGSAGAGGSISPVSHTIKSGDTTTLTVTPDAGYTTSASGCGGSLSETLYTTGPITSDCAVTATFANSNIVSGAPTPASSSTALDCASGTVWNGTDCSPRDGGSILFSINLVKHNSCINILNHDVCFWWLSLRF